MLFGQHQAVIPTRHTCLSSSPSHRAEEAPPDAANFFFSASVKVAPLVIDVCMPGHGDDGAETVVVVVFVAGGVVDVVPGDVAGAGVVVVA